MRFYLHPGTTGALKPGGHPFVLPGLPLTGLNPVSYPPQFLIERNKIITLREEGVYGVEIADYH